MYHARLIAGSACLALVALLAGCEEDPTDNLTGVDTHTPLFSPGVCDRNPNHHRCPPENGDDDENGDENGDDDGNGNAKGPFDVTIEFRNADGDMITGEGDYQDLAEIRDDGLLYWFLEEPFFIDFSDCASEEPPCGLSGEEPSGEVGALRVLENRQRPDPSEEGQLDGLLLGMAVADTLPAILRARIDHDSTQTTGNPRNRLTYHLHFQFPYRFDPNAEFSNVITAPDRSSFLTITRESPTEWTIEAPGEFGDLGIVFTERGSTGNPVLEDRGSYRLPFHMTVRCETCPAPPDS